MFWMHKNKLMQLKSLNKQDYYGRLANDKSKWKYKKEVRVDIPRTFPLDNQFLQHL
jgi:hypothetical protein